VHQVKALDDVLMEMGRGAGGVVDDAGGDELAQNALVDRIAQSKELQSRVQTLLST
jgi:hypothetical protein